MTDTMLNLTKEQINKTREFVGNCLKLSNKDAFGLTGAYSDLQICCVIDAVGDKLFYLEKDDGSQTAIETDDNNPTCIECEFERVTGEPYTLFLKTEAQLRVEAAQAELDAAIKAMEGK